MGIVTLAFLACIFILGASIGGGAVALYWIQDDKKAVDNIQKIHKLFEQQGFDFTFMMSKLRGMSVKAQATFAYQYVHMLVETKNKRMVGTLKRYLDSALIKTGTNHTDTKGNTL